MYVGIGVVDWGGCCKLVVVRVVGVEVVDEEEEEMGRRGAARLSG
jgi:hypothetical protein